MPGPIIHQYGLTTCLHQGPITAVPPAPPRVFVNNGTMAVLGVTPAPNVTVAGCVFTLPGPKPSPCLRVQLTPAARVFLNFTTPVAILTPLVQGVNEASIPQGPPNSLANQKRVIAT